MITLHGFAYSNYYNIVKHALMAKEIAFEENRVYPGEPGLLDASPLGKVPAITTPNGVSLSESSVILEYLEEAYPEKPLLPTDPEARGKVRQLAKIAELYLELPARRLLPFALGGQQAPEAIKTEVRGVLERGIGAVNLLARFSPFCFGNALTTADLTLRYALAIPKLVGPGQLDMDIIAAIEGLAEWDRMMEEDAVAVKIDADMHANRDEFMAYVAKVQGK
ncbi:MAG: glutathione S-transferase family protein [Chromatocurvus sp.]